jgi:hypothetical protein
MQLMAQCDKETEDKALPDCLQAAALPSKTRLYSQTLITQMLHSPS